MPVKHSLFVSVCPHLIYATLKSTSVVSSLNFATLCVILDTISRTIYLTMRILFSDHVIFLKKQIYCFIILSSVLLVHERFFFVLSASPYMDVLCGVWTLRQFTSIGSCFQQIVLNTWTSGSLIVDCTCNSCVK